MAGACILLHGSLDMALSALVNRESLLFSDTFIIRSGITASSHINKNSSRFCGNKGLNTTNATSGNDYAARFAGFVGNMVGGWAAAHSAPQLALWAIVMSASS